MLKVTRVPTCFAGLQPSRGKNNWIVKCIPCGSWLRIAMCVSRHTLFNLSVFICGPASLLLRTGTSLKVRGDMRKEGAGPCVRLFPWARGCSACGAREALTRCQFSSVRPTTEGLMPELRTIYKYWKGVKGTEGRGRE